MPLDKTEVARVEARLRSDIMIQSKPSKIVVDFGCDEVGEMVERAVYEDGSGRGGSLRLVRFERDTNAVAVTVIGSGHYGASRLVVEEGSLDLTTFDEMVEKARVALVARPHVVELMERDGQTHGTIATTSSNDFHLRLAISDGDGSTVDRTFTGYESSGEQERYLPMRLAAAPVQKVLSRAKLTTRAPNEQDRRFVTERFLITFAETPEWWVRERYVALVGRLGTTDAVPVLVRLANTKAEGDSSTERTRVAALDAIAALTGFDPWRDDAGGRRDVDVAASAAAAACGRSDAR